MGGKAIKKVPVIRLGLDRYEELKIKIMEIFQSNFQIDFLIDVPGKMDFGDLDILYYSGHTDNSKLVDIRKFIVQTLNPVEIVSNGDVISIAYLLESGEYFQVDFIKCKNISVSKFYFSYGDLGAIIGRITSNYGLTFGSDGLWINLLSDTISKFSQKYNIDVKYKKITNTTDLTNSNENPVPNYNFGKLFLSNDPIVICKYLDLNYEIWTRGFESSEDIFDWVCNSSWFKLEIFHSLNYCHRKRFILRPFYQKFIHYIFKSETDNPIDIIKCANEGETRINNQLDAIEHFNLIGDLENIIIKHNKNIDQYEKFNGNILLQMGIEHKSLGSFIKTFKNYIFNKYNLQFDSWIESNEKNIILNEIDIFYKLFETI